MAHNAILVVDDNDINIELITRVLRRTRFEVLTAYNGEEACRLLEIHRPAMILSDIMMPRMDGYAFLQRVRTWDVHAHLPFVFVSAKSTIDDVATGLEMGADDYLTKPFRPQELLALVDKYLPAMA